MTPLSSSADTAVETELARRILLWSELSSKCDPSAAPAGLVNELQIFFGGRGIWRDKKGLSHLADDGVTVGLLHTGDSYADDLDEFGVVYHYPLTKSPTTDAGEIEATKNASRLGLPLFTVVSKGGTRCVFPSRVVDWDDGQRSFLVEFVSSPTAAPVTVEPDADGPVVGPKEKVPTVVLRRKGQSRFSFEVLKRYGTACACCGLDLPGVVDAAHVVPASAGGQPVRANGLPMCPTHHRMWDSGYFGIEPDTRRYVASRTWTLAEMGVTRQGIDHLEACPASEALALRWDLDANESGVPSPE